MADNQAGGPLVLTEERISAKDGQVSGKSAVSYIDNNDAFKPVSNRPVTDIVFS